MRSLSLIVFAFPLCALSQSVAIPGSSALWTKSTASGAYTAATSQNAGTASLDASPALSASSVATFSMWVKMAAGTDLGGPYDFARNSSAHVLVRRNADNTLRIFSVNGSGTTVIDATTANTVTVASGWVNILINIDLTQAVAANRIHVYINNVDASPTIATSVLNGLMDFPNPNWGLPNNSSPPPCCMAEWYYNLGASLDMSVAGNRSKFNDGGSPPHPVSLGATGSTPTGSQPQFYLKTGGNSWNVNSGSAGNFTTTGTFTTCGTSP